jgi:hypothetical protein
MSLHRLTVKTLGIEYAEELDKEIRDYLKSRAEWLKKSSKGNIVVDVDKIDQAFELEEKPKEPKYCQCPDEMKEHYREQTLGRMICNYCACDVNPKDGVKLPPPLPSKLRTKDWSQSAIISKVDEIIDYLKSKSEEK